MSASEVAKAANALLHLSPGDEESLLEVIEDFFWFSECDEHDKSDLSDDELGENERNLTTHNKINVLLISRSIKK